MSTHFAGILAKLTAAEIGIASRLLPAKGDADGEQRSYEITTPDSKRVRITFEWRSYKKNRNVFWSWGLVTAVEV